MQKKCNRCDLCSWYMSYYKMGLYALIKADFGFCKLYHKNVNSREACEHWAANDEQRNERKNHNLKKLETLSKNLNDILLILKEEFKN